METDNKGLIWFNEVICKNCKKYKGGNCFVEDVQVCIEAEKLRVLRKIAGSLEYLGD